MNEGVEIYVRPSGDRILLNIYAADGTKKTLIAGLKAGTFEDRQTPVHVELSVLPEWITSDQEEAVAALEKLGSIHLRIPITAINLVG